MESMNGRAVGAVLMPLAAIVSVVAAAQETTMAAQDIAARFVADRVLVDLPLADGRRLRFFTDTGGGGVIVYTAAAARLGLNTQPTSAAGSDMPPDTAELAGPLALRAGLPPLPAKIIVARDPLADMGAEPDADGMLGQNWFAGRTWTWDYPRGTLTIEPREWRKPAAARPLPISFKAPMHFPRTIIEIAGEPTSMLLDTGVTTVLTPEAAAAIGGPRLRGTSMIAASRIAAWRKAHPDWPVIEQAQMRTGARMIRVPDVRIAGLQVGPVWFTERPDANFHTFMSSMTDAPVEGAIGGNALKSLRLTIDYVNATGTVSR